MDDREKLVELLEEAEKCADRICIIPECENCPAHKQGEKCVLWLVAGYLLANGVTVQPNHLK